VVVRQGACEVGEGREYGFPKEDMRGAGVCKDGGRGDGS
jgi:hypothetical protein